MLAQVLAIAVALGSALLFLTAFIFPKLHRQDDFFWSSVGLFYALVLWVCAGQMVGAVLLGQLASVILLGWLAWEMLRLRQAIIDPTKIPNLNTVSLVGYVKQRLNKPKPVVAPKAKTKSGTKPTEAVAPATTEETPTVVTENTTETPVETAEEIAAVTPDISPETETLEVAEVPEESALITPEIEPEPLSIDDGLGVAEDTDLTSISPESEKENAPTNGKKGFSLGRLFGKKAEPVAEVENPQSLDAIFAEETLETAIAPETSEVPETDSPETETPEPAETQTPAPEEPKEDH